jgi:hypothetical protein
MTYHHLAMKELEKGRSVEELIDLPVQEEIARAKFIPEDAQEMFDRLEEKVVEQLSGQATGVKA